MHNHARRLTTTLVMALALTVGACGDTTTSTEQGSGTSGATKSNAANITFRTDPSGVEVWIDGTKAGTTPVVLALEAGSHDVAMKHEGFEAVTDSIDVEAGKDLTVTTALAVVGEPEARVKTLLAALGIPEHETIPPKAHRGTTPPVRLYWPQRDVRKDGLTTWRIEIGDYEDDGFLVFKKGSKVLYREPFIATSMVMEGALPSEVMEELKRGSTITWGIEYEGRGGKDVMAKFTVQDGRKLERKLDKLRKRSVFRRAGPLEREIAQIELKRNYRYYTEALTDAMSVLNTWPDTMLADKIIADSLQRLKLKDSVLYVEIMKRLRGHGPGGAGRESAGLGTVARPLPPSLVAPKVRAPVASKDDAGSGMKPGLGVKPTGGSAGEQPGAGSLDEGGTNGGQAVDPATARAQDAQARREEVRQLQEELARLKETAEETATVEQHVREAGEALARAREDAERAEQAAADAEQAVRDAEAAGDAAGIAAAKEAFAKARKRVEEMAEAARAAENAQTEAAKAARETMERNGSSEEARLKAQELERRIEEASQPKEHEQVGPQPQPGQDPLGVDPLAEAPEQDSGMTPEALRRSQLEQNLQNAQEVMRTTTQWIESSRTSLQSAQDAYEAATKALDEAEASGDASRIEAAEKALGAAHETLSRSTMELERAVATKLRADEALKAAQNTLDQWVKDGPQAEPGADEPVEANGR